MAVVRRKWTGGEEKLTKTNESRRSGEPFTTDGTGKDKATTLESAPQALVSPGNASSPRGDDSGDADQEPVNSGQSDGGPEYDTGMSIGTLLL